MNQHDATGTTARLRDDLAATAAQLLPAAGFGLRVAVLAGVVLGAGLVTADLSAPVEALGQAPMTTCCIETGEA